MSFTNFPGIYRVEDKKIEGDAANPAAFFVERYWKLLDYKDRTIAKLLPIAAHSALMANILNPSGVEGLEVAICRYDACELVKDVSELREFSTDLDSAIGRRLGCIK
jgi:hypothetical protein